MAGFTFGAPAPAAGGGGAGAPAPAPVTGGFSFGAAAPTPAAGAPAASGAPTPAPATGGFSFGAAAPAPAAGASGAPAPAAPAPSGGFSFGAAAAPTPAAPAPAAGGAPTPAPATGGFNFGGAAPAPAAANAPAPATTAGGTSSAPTPAPAAGGFSFGGTSGSSSNSTAAPSTTTAPAASTGTAAPAPAAGGFSFGGGGTTTTTTPAPAVGTSTTTTAPTTGATPAAAAGGGFSFSGSGGAGSSTTTATTGTTGTTGAAPAPSTTTGTFSFSGGGTSAPSTSTTTTSTTTTAPAPATKTEEQKPTIEIPPYETLFPYLSIQNKIQSILSQFQTQNAASGKDNVVVDANSLLGQEFIHLLQTNSEEENSFSKLLSNPTSLLKTTTTPDNTLRQNLKSHPYIRLHSKIAGMTPSILEEILTLADELHITEVEAIALYAGVSDESTRLWLEEKLVMGGFVERSLLDVPLEETIGGSNTNTTQQQQQQQGSLNQQQQQQPPTQNAPRKQKTTPLQPLHLGNDVPKAAKELYFYERSALLSTLLELIHFRLQAAQNLSSEETETTTTSAIIVGTDALLQSGLITNLVQCIKELTVQNEEIGRKIREIQRSHRLAMNNNMGAAAATATMGTAPTFGGGMFGTTTTTPAATAPTTATNTQNQINEVDYALQSFTYTQRHIASECLFYITYYTQCSITEIVDVIDLIQNITNGSSNQGGIGCGLPILLPWKDTPNFYKLKEGVVMPPGTMGSGGFMMPQQQQQPFTQQQQQYPYNPYNQQQTPYPYQQQGTQMPQDSWVEKDPKEWEYELIMSLWGNNASSFSSSQQEGEEEVVPGRPQLLQTVSSLVMSVLCMLDCTHLLVDRDVHGFNSFGLGNAILPPSDLSSSSSPDALQPIHSRLDGSLEKKLTWKRKDIWGLLSASYALLLRQSASTITSPKAGGGDRSPLFSSPTTRGRGGSFDMKSSFRSSLQIAMVTKSLTFARLSLLPSFGTASMNPSLSSNSSGGSKAEDGCSSSNFAFYMSVLSEFTSHYLEALCASRELPISRAQWLSDEEKELQLRHVQEQQRLQFNQMYGQNTRPDVTIPTEVDITERPDCVDDVIALAVAVCAACPVCARQFWSTTEEEVLVEEATARPAESGGSGAFTTHLRLVPSRTLKKIERLRENDSTLLPAYVNFLSALALAEAPDTSSLSQDGAFVVNKLLSNASSDMMSPPSPSTDRGNKLSWVYILNAVRWYVDELMPPSANASESSRRNTAQNLRRSSSYEFTEGRASTAYYYGSEGNGVEGSYRHSQQQTQSGGTSFPSSSTSSMGMPQKKELGEENTITLLSLLGLISNVALKSSQGREDILSIKLPPPSNNMAMTGGGPMSDDDALNILFSLLTVSVTPEVRGMTLVAIANLIRCDHERSLSQQEKERCIEIGRRGWDLLESCQLIPISVLGQYAPFMENGQSNSASNQTNITGLGQRTSSSDCWFPRSEKYNILFDMEYIESQKGSYPATEGLLYLISALITTCGCPPDLGSFWRPRHGCSPYVEYAVDFVLPRAMGTKAGDKGLYFASQADKSRLVCRGLEVVEAVIARYVVPIPIQTKVSEPLSSKGLLTGASSEVPIGLSMLDETIASYNSTTKSSADAHGLGPIASKIFYAVDDKDVVSVEESLRDFSEESSMSSNFGNVGPGVQHQQSNLAYHTNNPQTPAQAGATQLPRAKSPGFSVAMDILSSTGGSLFHILAKILLENNDARGIECMYGQAVYSKMLAMALFNDVPPVYTSAKRGRDYAIQVQQQQNVRTMDSIKILPSLQLAMIQPLLPPFDNAIFDKSNSTTAILRPSANDAIMWRERTVLVSLRILCAAAGREESLIKAVKSSPISLNIVPVLRFQAPVRGAVFNRGLEVRNVQISRLSQLLITASGASAFRDYPSEIIPVIAQYVGYNATSLHDNQEIARAAISIILYLSRTVPHRDCLPALCGHRINGRKYLADAISRRLCFTSDMAGMATEKDVRDVILDLLLTDVVRAEDQNLSHVLLGLTKNEIEARSKNCLDAVLDLLSDTDFVLNPQTSSYAAKCYQLIYRVCSIPNNDNQSSSRVWSAKVTVMSKLRKTDFWHNQILRFFASSGSSSVSLLRAIVSSAKLDDQSQASQLSHLLKRNNDVMHSISWLLKGVAVELHSLMGLGVANIPTNDVSSTAHMKAVAPQPRQCQKLLHLLYSKPREFMLDTLMDLPLHQSRAITQYLDVTAPPREVVQASCTSLPGAWEVTRGYEVVDVDRLLSNMRNAHGDEKVALQWANTWNLYVMHSCASSHLSTAWGMVLGTTLVSCRPLLFAYDYSLDYSSTLIRDQVLCKDDLIGLVCAILSRIGSADYHHRRTSVDVEEQLQDDGEIDAGTALPLSVSVLRLVELITEPLVLESPQADSGKILSVGEEELMEICTYIVDAIASCSDKAGRKGRFRSDDRGAVLSCALTAILSHRSFRSQTERSKAVQDSSFQRFVLSESDLYVSAATYLANLAAINGASSHFDGTVTASQTAHAEKVNAIALSARSGLSSLLALFDTYEKEYIDHTHNFGDSFVAQVFGNNHGKSPSKARCLQRLVQLVASFDTDVPYTIQQIACCSYGTELLLNAGIISALNSAANEYLKEEMELAASDLELHGDMVGRETFGAVHIEPPAFLMGHLSLLNVMLASSCPPLPLSSRQRMAIDAAKFLQIHANTGERLLRSYPKNGDLATKYVTCLYLTSSALGQSDNGNVEKKFGGFTAESSRRKMDLSTALDGRTLARLERRVLDLACHLSEYPFPSQLVPPFPTRLREVERSRVAKMRHLNVNTSKGRCWWDLILSNEGASTSAMSEQFSLPDPPTGSADAGGWRRKNIGRGDYRSGWSEEKYALATASAETNEACLTFLKSRAMAALSNSTPLEFSVDGVSIGKGLCRCSDAARAIQDRLNFMCGTTGEGEISAMMDDSAMIDTSSQNAQLSFQVNRIERTALSSLGPVLGRCAESLLVLASLQLHLFTRDLVASKERAAADTIQERIDEFSLALLPALEHTEIETMGVGCMGEGERADFCKKISQNLRGELERFARLPTS